MKIYTHETKYDLCLPKATEAFAWVDDKPYFESHSVWYDRRDWRQNPDVICCDGWEADLEWNCSGHILDVDPVIEASLKVDQPVLDDSKLCVVAVILGSTDTPWVTVPYGSAFSHAGVICERRNPYNMSGSTAIQESLTDYLRIVRLEPDRKVESILKVCGPYPCVGVVENVEQCDSETVIGENTTSELVRANSECPNGWITVRGMCFRMFSLATHSKSDDVHAQHLCEHHHSELASAGWLTHQSHSNLQDFVLAWFSLLNLHTASVVTLSMAQDCSVYSYIAEKDGIKGGFFAIGTSHNSCLLQPSDSTLCIKHPSPVSPRTCLPGHFMCRDGTCIASVYKCDGISHCLDESDEAGNCSHICITSGKSLTSADKEPEIFNARCRHECRGASCQCLKEFFQCRAGGCVQWSLVCDGRQHCNDGSDEKMCAGIPATYNNNPDYQDETAHHSGRNIVAQKVLCLYDRYATDFKQSTSGEQLLRLCPLLHPECPAAFRCAWFASVSTYCIPFHMVCDGTPDCPRGEDERGCQTLHCPGLLRCTSENTCLHFQHVNDGIAHCGTSRDDELFNQDKPCPGSCSCWGYVMDCASQALSTVPQNALYIKALVFSNNSLNTSHLPILSRTMAVYVLALYLDHNGIQGIAHEMFEGFENLLFLSLGGNKLSVLPPFTFGLLSHLLELDLRENTIRQVSGNSFFGLKYLTELDLSGLGISTVEDCAFRGLDNLERLSLSSNNMTAINRETFCGLRKVRTIDIRQNEIEWIDSRSFVSIKHLDVLEGDHRKVCCAARHVRICTPAPTSGKPRCASMFPSPILRWLSRCVSVCTLLFNVGSASFWLWGFTRSSSQRILSVIVNVCLNIVDFTLGIGLSCLWISDIIYGENYVLHEDQWKASNVCRFSAFTLYFSFVLSNYVTCLLAVQRFLATVVALKRIEIRHRVIVATIAIGVVLSGCTFALNVLFSGKTKYVSVQFKLPNSVCLPLSARGSSGYVLSSVTFTLMPSLLMLTAIVIQMQVAVHMMKGDVLVHSNQGIKSRKVVAVRNITASGIMMTGLIILNVFVILNSHILQTSGNPGIPVWLATVLFPLYSFLNPIVNTFSTRAFQDKISTAIRV